MGECEKFIKEVFIPIRELPLKPTWEYLKAWEFPKISKYKDVDISYTSTTFEVVK